MFSLSLLAPLCLPLAARLLRGGPICTFAVAFLGLLLWWTCYFRWFYTAGMVTYVAACYVGVLYAAWMWRYLTGTGGRGMLIGLGLAAGILVFFHNTAPVFVVIVIAWSTLLNWRSLRKPRMLAVIFVVPAICLLLNLVWIAPTLSSGMYFHDIHTKESFLIEIDPNLIWQELLGFDTAILSKSRVYLPIAIFAILGVAGDRTESIRLWSAWLVAGISIEIVRSVGGAVSWIAMMQPYRFSPAGYLLMAIPAGRGLELTILSIGKGFSARQRWFAYGVSFVLLACFGFLAREALREAIPGNHPHIGQPPPYVQGVGPKSRWAIDWLKANTDSAARVLFETTRGRFHDGASVAGYVTASTDREMIGGRIMRIFLRDSGMDSFLANR